MPTAWDSASGEIVEQVVAIVRERLSDEQAPLVEGFVRQYYGGIAAEDLAERDAANLYGAALAHLNFLRQRQPGSQRVRVFNPQLDEYGWQSTHTIVEIAIDDMPFLVDSVRMALNRRGLTIHLIVHPVMRFVRDDQGRVSRVLETGEGADGAIVEAVMHFEVDRQADRDVLDGMGRDVEQVLLDVRTAVDDWKPMRERLEAVLQELGSTPPPLPAEELEEGRAFLAWMLDNHFTLLGFREYTLETVKGDDVLRSVKGSSLGVLRASDSDGISGSFASLPPAVRALARQRELLVITKANSRSTVHRPGYMDYIGVKRFDEAGDVVGEYRFLGLYTSVAYNSDPRRIPLLRRKVDSIVRRAGYLQNSHAAKALLNILETYPRDELFQQPEAELFQAAMGILHLQERQRIRLFVHRDLYARYFSCIVYVPRERFNTQIRERIQGILADALGAESSEFTVQLSDSVLARLYFVMRGPPGVTPDYDVRALEARLVSETRSWQDDFYVALLDHFGEERGTRLFRRYGDAFKAAYRENYTARIAVHDVARMEELAVGDSLAMTLYRPLEAPERTFQFKLFQSGDAISLSDALPMLENMGLRVADERPSRVSPEDGSRIWIHDFGLTHQEPDELDLQRVRDRFQDTFARVWLQEVENDGFNRLVLRAGLSWREIVILRACCKYLRQAGTAFSQEYMERTLAANPEVTRLLVELFHARFDPIRQAGASRDVDAVVARIETALDAVANLDEDRILRSFLGLMQATLRTNYYQRSQTGEHHPYLSFKFDPKGIAELPEPRPMYEIWVYSPRVEGVHLRGGPVARGGLRWSDRREDFRTEVLGLVKAQMVKNAVIVPVGSKGGFVPKRLPAGGSREEVLAEGIACYRTFIRGMLDLTDNLVAGEVVPPRDVVRHDTDDPYLVVAADKGTATFSDIANAVAAEYGFWLGDAFASGGSQGYDHKKMGITARGAWESVKRHFRELGIDVQNTEFTAVGIGDMAGDVFGNGMLQSPQTRLVAAFNHMHIFLDPEPDARRSFSERQRLFALPRSTWDDYERALISEGGGIHARSAKSIPLTAEVQAALGVDAASLTPNELIRCILEAPVDLLWNGGIGTYVKASTQQHSDAGDRANDGVRVNGRDLRCRVVGEGGNLGMTQLGRVEFASLGGRVNTDAIDNVGGVDCSDHEVNIKILLNGVVQQGDMTEKQRNRLLTDMTDEVAGLVLRNNYLQTQALSLALAQAPSLIEVHSRLVHALEREVRLDRHIESLPVNDEIAERHGAGRGFVSPELSVLMAYVKIAHFQALLASDMPDDPFFLRELINYFPTPLRERLRDEMPRHRLYREIISTEVANGMVNRGGITFAFRLGEETGADVAGIARAWMAAREIFAMPGFWRAVEALDNLVPAATQTAMMLESRKLVERGTRWLLRNRSQPVDVAAAVEQFSPGVAELREALAELLPSPASEALQGVVGALLADGVPAELAHSTAAFSALYSALDIVEVVTACNQPVARAGGAYFALGAALELDWLRERIVSLPRENRWQTLARAALRDDLYAQQRLLTVDVLRSDSTEQGHQQLVESWMARNSTHVSRCRQVLAELKSAGTADFAMMSVAMREIRALRLPDSTARSQIQAA